MPRTLVIGAGGFAGRALSAAFEKRGRNAVRATRAQGDLADPKYCRKILKGVGTVYYLAGAKKNLRFHTQEPFAFVEGNVRPFLTFLQALAQSRVKTFLYLSSTIVAYVDSNLETDGYVLGKQINEQVFWAFQRQFPKIEMKLVRSAPIYGPGDNFKKETANFIPATIMKAANAKGEIEVWGQGKRRLQFIYIDDLVRNLLAAEKTKGNFFVFGNPESASVNEVVHKIIKLSGKNLKLKNNWQKADKPTKLAKFKNLIRPQVSLEEGLARTIKYFHA